MRESVMKMAIEAYKFMQPFYEGAFCTAVFLCLPLAFWRRFRDLASSGFTVLSIVSGFSAWLLGASVTLGSFGWLGLIVGCILLGIGVVPLGICGAYFNLDNGHLAWVLIKLSVVTFVASIISLLLRVPVTPTPPNEK